MTPDERINSEISTQAQVTTTGERTNTRATQVSPAIQALMQ